MPNDNNLPPVVFTPRDAFELAQREATVYSKSTLVPVDYQNNVANCMIAKNMANRLNADVLMVMQNLYIVHNRPAWSAQFMIASFNQCGRFSTMRFEWASEQGKEDWGCRAYAIEKATQQRIDGPWVTWKMVKAEGWLDRKGSKWQTIPGLMFHYRAAAFLVRTHAPEVSMGIPTADEVHDIIDVTPEAPQHTATQTNALDAIKDRIRATTAPPSDVIDVATGEINTADNGTETEAKVAAALFPTEPPPAAEKKAPPSVSTGGPAPTYVQVHDQINAAKDKEALDLARDQIRFVAHEQHRAELDVEAMAKLKTFK